MKNSNHSILVAVALVAIFVVGYIAYRNSISDNNDLLPTNQSAQKSTEMVLEDTPKVDGVLVIPAGFPKDIPVDQGSIIESVTTTFPAQDAKQLSVTYKTTKTIVEKYTEYKNYMTKVGYQVEEGDNTSPVRAIFGTRADVNLSVAISRSGDSTLVQLSYLVKNL